MSGVAQIDGEAIRSRLAGWLFGVRDAAATRERDGQLAGILFFVAAVYSIVVVSASDDSDHQAARVGVIVAYALSSSVCLAIPWRRLPNWSTHVPSVTWIVLLGLGQDLVGGAVEIHTFGYVLIFLYVGITSSVQMIIQLTALAEVCLVVALLYGNQSAKPLVLAVSIIFAALLGQVPAIAISWSQTANELLVLVRRSCGSLLVADTEANAADQIADVVARLVDADDVLVLMNEYQGSQVYTCRGAETDIAGFSHIRIDTSRDQSGFEVLVHGQASLFVPEAEGSPLVSQRLVEDLGISSVFYMPIMVEGGMVGVIIAWWAVSRQMVDPLGQRLAELVPIYASQILQRLRHVGRLDSPAMRDPLTGVGNRHRFDAAMTELPVGGTILLFDLDAFATFTEMFGREAGNEVVCDFAGALRRSVRQNDVVTRLSEDRFGVVLPALASPIASGIIIERLQRAWRAPQRHHFSVGVATRTAEEAPAEVYLRAEIDLRATRKMKTARMDGIVE